MSLFKSDMELFSFIREHVCVAEIGDILAGMGFRDQAMHQRLRPLLPDMRKCGFAGRAKTFFWMETHEVNEDDPYGLEIEAMDALGEGDVVIHSTDVNGTNAPWGELMSTISKRKGVRGCVCDSQVRDCVKIIEMDFPVFYAGIRPLDSKGRGMVTAYNVSVQCGEVTVDPGDLICADFDGVVVVPKKLEAEVMRKAGERLGRRTNAGGGWPDGRSLREIMEKYKTTGL